MPPSGGYYLVSMQDGRPSPGHKFCTSLEQLAAAAIQVDKREDVQVYFALATYAQDHILVDGKKKWRVPENKLEVKAFWFDIDCGAAKAEAGKGYPTKRDAVEALKQFCAVANMPFPTINDSGNGLHIFWGLTEAISTDTWQPIANRLKALTKQLGLLADDSRTADSASILRMPNTHNKKGEPKLVRVVVQQKELIVPSDFNAKIIAVLKEDVSTPTLFGEPVPEYLRATVEDNTQAHTREFRPSDANKIADNCQQMAAFRETGVANYLTWFAAIGVLKHCVDGEEVTHEWSAKYPKYDRAETQTKYDTYSKGPTTCDKFRSDNPAGCAGCKFFGEIKSPISLGTGIDIPAEEITTVIGKDGSAVEITIPKLPRGFKFDKVENVLTATGGDDGPIAISNTLFYLTGWTSTTDEHFAPARVHDRNGQIRDFKLSTAAISQGSGKLLEELGKAAVLLTINKEALIMATAYLKLGLGNLQAAAPAKQQLAQLGWNRERTEFALGRYIVCRGGKIQMAELSGAAERGIDLGPKGNIENWVSGVDELYNKAGMEPFQYAICAALGSILTPLANLSGYRGIPLAFTGTKSGTGKTTVCRVALSTMGSPDTLIFNGLKNGTTENALYASFAALQNIPVLLDEVTNISGDELSRVVYSIANGQNKMRLRQDGTPMPVYRWNSISYMTANVDLSAMLVANRQNSEAEALRFIEVYMDDMPEMPMAARLAAEEAIRRIESAAGTPAMAFLNFCLANPAAVNAALSNAEAFVNTNSGDGTQERRFYIGQAVCTIAAANIMRQLGLVSFDVMGISKWIVGYIASRSVQVQSISFRDASDVLSQFINEHSRHIIVSKLYADAREATAVGEQLAMGVQPPFIGRMVTGAAGEKDKFAGHFIVRASSIREFCLMNRYSYKKLLQELEKSKCLFHTPDVAKHNITKGIISQPPMQLASHIINIERLFGGSNAPILAVVAATQSDLPIELKDKRKGK